MEEDTEETTITMANLKATQAMARTKAIQAMADHHQTTTTMAVKETTTMAVKGTTAMAVKETTAMAVNKETMATEGTQDLPLHKMFPTPGEPNGKANRTDTFSSMGRPENEHLNTLEAELAINSSREEATATNNISKVVAEEVTQWVLRAEANNSRMKRRRSLVMGGWALLWV